MNLTVHKFTLPETLPTSPPIFESFVIDKLFADNFPALTVHFSTFLVCCPQSPPILTFFTPEPVSKSSASDVTRQSVIADPDKPQIIPILKLPCFTIALLSSALHSFISPSELFPTRQPTFEYAESLADIFEIFTYLTEHSDMLVFSEYPTNAPILALDDVVIPVISPKRVSPLISLFLTVPKRPILPELTFDMLRSDIV